jgi:hypothetical protein
MSSMIHLLIMTCTVISSIMSYVYMNNSSFSSLPRQNILILCTVKPASVAAAPNLSMYICLNSAIESQFEHSKTQSPFGERTFNAYRYYWSNNLYMKNLFSRLLFAFQFRILIVHTVIYWFRYAAYGHAVVDPIFIDN